MTPERTPEAARIEAEFMRVAMLVGSAFTEGYRAGFVNDGGSDEHGAWRNSETRRRLEKLKKKAAS